MNNRIKLLLTEQGISANKFAEKIGVQASGISHIISGRNKPGYDFIVKVLEAYPEINPDWLLMGKDPMYRSKVNPEALPEELQGQEKSERAANISPRLTERKSSGSATVPEPAGELAFVQEEQSISSQENSSNISRYRSKVITKSNVSMDQDKPRDIDSIIIFFADKTFKRYMNGDD